MSNKPHQPNRQRPPHPPPAQSGQNAPSLGNKGQRLPHQNRQQTGRPAVQPKQNNSNAKGRPPTNPPSSAQTGPRGQRPKNAPPRPEGGRPVPPKQQKKRRPPQPKSPRRSISIPTRAIANVILTLMLGFILLVAVHFVMLLAQISHRQPNYNITVRHLIGEEVARTTQTNRRDVFRDGSTVYVNFSRLVADSNMEIGLVTVGARDFTMFSFRGDTNQRVVFTPDSSEINMNGRSLRLSAPVQFVGSYVYVPACFFWHYTSGIEVNFDGEQRVLYITRQVIGDDENDENDENDKEAELIAFTFNIHQPTMTEEIEQPYWIGDAPDS